MTAQANGIFYQRVLAVGGLALVAFMLYQIVEPFLGPLAWAIFLGFML